MRILKKQWQIFVVTFLLIAVGTIWHAIWKQKPTTTVTVAFLNVGQGDAIFIESPTRNQILIDGGPRPIILSELRKVMPWFDRTIDTIIVTNPDADHYAGFISVLENYKVSRVIEPGTKSDTETYKRFSEEVDEERAEELVARRGQTIDIGGGAYIKILFPDTDVSNLESNEGSIIAQLVYGETEVMLTGDTVKESEEYVLTLGEDLESDILKVAHHGSRTSSDEDFVRAVKPQYAIVSAGKNNRYGHPHKETLETLRELGVQVLGTYEQGTIIFKLDGTKIFR